MNKVVLITGASRGIGAATALKFAREGYSVIINYNNSKDKALNVLEEVNKYSSNNMIIKADISNEEEVISMFNVIKEKYTTIDILVNNAGIAIDSLVDDKTVENFTQTLKVNLIGAFLCARCFSKITNNGSIVNVSSTNGIDTYYPYSLDYDASKAGLISLTHNLAVEYGPNIRVNAVAPGWVNTEMNQELDEEYIKEESEKIILKRFASPEEIANVVFFLSSDEAKFINSEVIRVDGGLVC